MTDVTITNKKASNIYNSEDYTTPYSTESTAAKKYTPFSTFLYNVYDLTLTNVRFNSFNYLIALDIPIRSYPLWLFYDTTVPYFKFTVNNVVFQDCSFEDMSIFEVQEVQFVGLRPDLVQTFTLNAVQIIDSYFINKAALIAQSEDKQASSGNIKITGLTMQRNRFNNSKGIATFDTAQSLTLKESIIIDCFVNDTFLLYSNTFQVSDISVTKTVFQNNSRLMHTQFSAPYMIPNNAEKSGLTFDLDRIRFSYITCSNENCFIYASSPSNEYDQLMNVSIANVQIAHVITSEFNLEFLESANSAMIFVTNVLAI